MTNSLNSPIWGYGPQTWKFGMISLQKKVVNLGWQPSTINGRVLTHAYTCLHPDGHTDLLYVLNQSPNAIRMQHFEVIS